jgi:E3 ubiquitin-protein ligase SIAH1
MEDLSRALDEALLKDLECPVCMEYMVPPIKLCKNGHNICSSCKNRVQYCPTCKVDFSEIRNLALENIARRQKYPCPNRKSGCLDLFSIEHIAEHHAVCGYWKMNCPFFKTNLNCSWQGFKSDLKEHTKAEHPEFMFERSELFFSSRYDDRVLVLLSYFGELFVYYQRIRDGKLYGAVQLIGTSSEASKYKCEFTLRAANGIEEISKTFLVRSSTEDWETSFNSGKCLRLDEVTVRNFLLEYKLKLNLTLSPV